MAKPKMYSSSFVSARFTVVVIRNQSIGGMKGVKKGETTAVRVRKTLVDQSDEDRFDSTHSHSCFAAFLMTGGFLLESGNNRLCSPSSVL